MTGTIGDARKRHAPQPPTIEEVLAAHADCTVNGGSQELGSGTTGTDVWSCGIELPFVDDYDDMHRAHVAAALREAGAR